VAVADLVDRPAFLAGLRTGLTLVVPVGLFTAALTDSLPGLVRVLFVLVIVAGFGSAGAQAARVAEEKVVATGAYAAGATYLVIQVPLALVRLARGETLGVWTYIFLVLTAMSCGTIGALLVLRSRNRHVLEEE
jgi:hypothetical protein